MVHAYKENSWQTQQAKAHLSEVIKKALVEGDQFITHHGEKVAVLISKERYDEFLRPKDSLLDFFLKAPYSEMDLNIQRDKDFPREIEL